MTSSPVLEARGLVRRFGGVVALDGVDLALFPATIHAVIGPNGSGKTTLLNCLSGVDRPQSGSIRLEGRQIAGNQPHRVAERGLARTFQNIQLFASLSVLDNVRVAAQRHHPTSIVETMIAGGAHRTAERETTERAREALEFVGLSARADDRAGALPYAQQRLLEIARALAAEPKVLLLDEPAAGMNMTEAMALVLLIGRMCRKIGISIILVEHNVRLVMDVSDVITVLDFGRRIAEGTPGEIQKDPAVIEAYLGRRRARA